MQVVGLRRWCASVAVLLGIGAVCAGCSSTNTESAGADTKLAAHIGEYSAPPQGVAKPRVGVPPFKVTTAGGWGGGSNLDELAADQMDTLLYKTGRFDVIERTQLKKLVDEQNLEGIVKSGELAKTGQVRGVDYLVLGKVTNLRVKQTHQSNGFGLAQLGGVVNLGGADVKKDTTEITTECGVDIRLVDPSTGKVMVAESSEFKRTDTAGGMGIAILGANAHSENSINLSDDDKGKILRLALDDALRKALPDIDNFLRRQGSSSSSRDGTVPVAPVTSQQQQPSAAPAAGKKFCPECGKPVEAGAKFCPSCGHKME